MANEFIIRKGLISLEDSQITGSLSVTNSVTASFFTGSYRGDGSQLTGIEGFPFTGSAGITGSLTVVGPVNATTFTGDGSQLTGIEGFPFTGSAKITGSLEVTGSVTATSFTGSLQGTATSASYVQLANVDGFTAYSASVNTAIDSVLDATTPLTATVNTTNSPFTVTSQSIVIIDSTDGDVTVNLPDLNAINGTPDQKPILLYKNDYSQNVIYVQPSGSQLVNGTTQDIIVSIQIAIAYNPTSAGWVTEGTSYQSLAELEMFFVPRTETGSLSVATASYVEYSNVANKPSLISGSEQVTYSGLTGVPVGIVSGSEQVTYSGLTGIPSGILSGSAQIADFGIFATTGSNGFNGSQSITGSLTVTGQVVAQTLNVQQVTSSIVFSSGSNIFGNSLSNTQQFTGSVGVTGSLTVAGQGYFGSTNYSNIIVDGTNATGWGNNIAFRSQGTDFGYLGSIGSLLGNTTKDMTIWATSGNGIRFYTNGNNFRAIIDTSGNLGLGVTPSAWDTYKAFQIGAQGSLASTSTVVNLSQNAFWSTSGHTYITTDTAAQYHINGGTHTWRTAASGTGGNTITWTQAMNLDASGRLGIGSTSPSATLDVGSNKTLSGTDPISVYTDVRVASAVTGGLIGYNLRMVALAGSYTVANMYGIKTNTPVVQSGVTVTNSYGIYIGRTDDGVSGGVVTNKYALVTEATAGNVGIGTTTPTHKLHVLGTTGLPATSGTTQNGTLRLQVAGYGTVLDFGAEGPATGKQWIQATNNTDLSITYPLLLNPNGGNVGIGTVSPTKRLNVEASVAGEVAQITNARNSASGDYVFVTLLGANAMNTNSYHYIAAQSGGADRLYIYGNGNVVNTNGSYGTLSDISLKENIVDATPKLADLLQLKVRNFNLIGSEEKQIGFVAQEFEEIFPKMVDIDGKNGMKTIKTSVLVPMLVKAIQEQQSQIEILKAEIQTLKQ